MHSKLLYGPLLLVDYKIEIIKYNEHGSKKLDTFGINFTEPNTEIFLIFGKHPKIIYKKLYLWQIG